MSAGLRPVTRAAVGALAVVALAAALQAPARADDGVEVLLGRAVEAGREVAHEGRLVVATFGERGPQVTELLVRRGPEGMTIARPRDGGMWRVTGGSAPAQEVLLEVRGAGHDPDQLRRLRAKYRVERLDTAALDTGPATPLRLVERGTGTSREVLYLDRATGLVVRRETFRRDGSPLRLVAYTELRPGPGGPTGVRPAGRAEHTPPGIDEAALRAAGFDVPVRLPGGYELVAAGWVRAVATPTVHLVYADGLYSLSVFQQPGRLDPAARREAAALTVPGGGVVWRWPGSEPRRLVWTGGGSTFTALSDGPTDEVVAAIGRLPVDAREGALDRLYRGLERLVGWVRPGDRDGTEATAPAEQRRRE